MSIGENRQYKITLGDRQFVVESNVALSPEQINSYAAQKLGIGGECSSCASANAAGGIPKLGTAVCGGPYVQNTSKTLTGSVTSGGTAPFTYTWTITPPTGAAETYSGATKAYTFAQAGTYTVKLNVTDSCPTGGLTDSATCSVIVTAPCVTPVCNIGIA